MVRLRSADSIETSRAVTPETPVETAAPEAPSAAPDSAPTPEAPTGAAPSLRVALDSRTRALADPLTLQLRARIDAKIPEAETDPTTRPPGEPFAPRTRDEIDGVVASADASGDLSELDEVDNFRQTLSPELQAEYDAQLEELRNDPRLEFEYREGVDESAAMEDLALRGILASTFGNPTSLDQTLDQQAGEDGVVPIVMFDGPVPIPEFYPGAEAGSTAAGLALPVPDGGIAIDAGFLRDAVAQGDNPFVHEFAHLTQRTTADGEPIQGQRFPGDFPYEEHLLEEFEDPAFQQFIVDRFFGGNPPTDDAGNPLPIAHAGAETWPTLMNLFRQYPEELAANGPEIYRSMSEYFGYDPLTQTETPPVQLNGTGSIDASTDALLEHFGSLPTHEDGHISNETLEQILAAPDASLPPDVRAAAAFLLSSDVSRQAVDVGAGRGDVDGKISREDLEGIEQQLADGVEPFELLADTANGRGGRDHHISDDDLRALVSDPGVPDAVRVRAAVQLFLRG